MSTTKPTVYIAHSTKYDYVSELYNPISRSVFYKDINFIFPHENTREPYDSRSLFISGRCKAVIAEISLPATGLGIELGWADLLNIPILCISQEDSKISRSIECIYATRTTYTTSLDLVKKIGHYIYTVLK